MRTIVSDVVSMPSGCETSRFVACFASMFMRAEGMTDAGIEVYCPKQNGDCAACGDCGDVNRLRKRHEQVYNLFSVVSGCGFMQIDLSDDTHMSRDWDQTCDILLSEFDDYIKFTMDFAGYTYKTFSDADDKESVFAEIRRSIDSERPVLMQFKGHLTWVVVTGYDDEGRIYGYDGSYGYWGKNPAEPEGYDGELFYMMDWYAAMGRVIALDQKFAPTLTMSDVYSRAVRIMEYTAGLFERSEQYVRDDTSFDALPPDALVQMRDRISQFIGLPIDMRSVVSWHIPVPPEKVLIRCSDRLNKHKVDPRDLAHLFTQLNSCCCYIHDTLWIAWRSVGEFMGESKEYWGQELRSKPTRRVIADVIGIVAHYDRDIHGILKRIVGGK